VRASMLCRRPPGSRDRARRARRAQTKRIRAARAKEQRKKSNRTHFVKRYQIGPHADLDASATPSSAVFALTKSGSARPTKGAQRTAQSRKVSPIVRALLRAGGPEQQAEAARSALQRPELRAAAALLDLSGKEEAVYVTGQMGRVLQRATATATLGANVSTDRSEFVEKKVSTFAGCQPPPIPHQYGRPGSG
jgi:hypothetical protein